MKQLTKDILNINSANEFEQIALDLFRYHSVNNETYREYLNTLNIKKESVDCLAAIPFLPVNFFRSRRVALNNNKFDTVFESSGTTGANISRHYVHSLRFYEKSIESSFRYFYGNIRDYCILALVPPYTERPASSLSYMINFLISQSGCNLSGYYLNGCDKLFSILKNELHNEQKTLFFGLGYALLDFAEKHPLELTDNIIVMETGGMKGRREEMPGEELHGKLCRAFDKEVIHSEYGMTELLSQAYSAGGGMFRCPPWMKVFIRDIYDPFTLLSQGQPGGINIIDLANVYSCPFIETQDAGKINPDNTLEITGRLHNSPVRGCNLMI